MNNSNPPALRKQLVIKLCIALAVIAVAVAAVVIYNTAIKPKPAEADGEITIEVIDIDGNTVSSKKLGFMEGDTLADVLKRSFEVNSEDSEYGMLLYGIDDIQTDFKTTYIALYINGEASNYGASSVTPEDGSLYSFRETKI